MKNIYLFGLILINLYLSGCAGALGPTVADNTPNDFTVRDTFGAADTKGMAEAHCKKYGKHALFWGYTDHPAMICYDGMCESWVCVR